MLPYKMQNMLIVYKTGIKIMKIFNCILDLFSLSCLLPFLPSLLTFPFLSYRTFSSSVPLP